MATETAAKPTTEYEVIIGLEIHAELLTDAKSVVRLQHEVWRGA